MANRDGQGDYKSVFSIVVVVFLLIVIGTLIAMAIGSRLGLTKGTEWLTMVTTMKLIYFFHVLA